MNVNEKGSVGLIEVIRDLTKKGYECFTPLHDYSKIDLIAVDKQFNTIRLQVKYRTTYRDKIEIGFNSVVNGKKIPSDLSAVDGWAIYCPEVDTVVYVSKKEINVELGGFSFRLTEGKSTVNKDKEKLKIYKDFGDVAEWSKAVVC